MPRLTKPFIDGLRRPERGQLIVRDDEQPGFGVRLTPNHISYVAEGRLLGRSKRITIGAYCDSSVEESRAEAKRILAEMAAGVHPNTLINMFFMEGIATGFSSPQRLQAAINEPLK